MIKKNHIVPQLSVQPIIKSPTFILKIIPVLFIISGCYTVLTPPPDYVYKIENNTATNGIDTLISTITNIHIDCYSSCVHPQHCCNIHTRYNSWNGTYYCDPYYYNYSYYNHHCNNYNWWNSHTNWNNYNYSDNYTSSPSKITRRTQSFSRPTDDSVAGNFQQQDTDFSSSQSDSYSSQVNNSNSNATGNSSSTDNPPKKNNTKPRRKHNRKPL